MKSASLWFNYTENYHKPFLEQNTSLSAVHIASFNYLESLEATQKLDKQI
jgi:hypothetical protein